jgi:uncharacterized protein YegL
VNQTAYEESPFSEARFADNPDPRCACVLVLDRSGSMAGQKIQQLNEGLQQFRSELLRDEYAARRVEIAVVPFGPVVKTATTSLFHPAGNFNPQPMAAGNDTPAGAAVEYAVELVTRQKALYRSHGITYFRPWVILMTDGSPTDSIARATTLVHEGEAAKAFSFFAIGVDTADMATLARLSVRPPLKMRGIAFREFFLWLSSSLSGVSRSAPGTSIQIQPPSSWTIET